MDLQIRPPMKMGKASVGMKIVTSRVRRDDDFWETKYDFPDGLRNTLARYKTLIWTTCVQSAVRTYRYITRESACGLDCIIHRHRFDYRANRSTSGFLVPIRSAISAVGRLVNR